MIAPKKLVSKPIGISVGSTVRPRESQSSKKNEPMIIEAGREKVASLPKVFLAMWGVIKPTQPIRPVTLIVNVVPTVATKRRIIR